MTSNKETVGAAVAVILAVLSLAFLGGASLFELAEGQQQQSQTGTDGNLTATINGVSFKAGDTIVINGTVESGNLRPDSQSIVAIQVFDPNNRMVEDELMQVSKLGSDFVFRFMAGEVLQGDPNHIMRYSGNYTVSIRYTPPYIYGQEIPREMVNFTFGYTALG